MNLQEKINYVKNAAPNMVEVSNILNSVTQDYLNKYAAEQDKAPCDVAQQPEWVLRATMYFISNIVSDCNKIWEAIPVRFHKTEIYKKIGPTYVN